MAKNHARRLGEIKGVAAAFWLGFGSPIRAIRNGDRVSGGILRVGKDIIPRLVDRTKFEPVLFVLGDEALHIRNGEDDLHRRAALVGLRRLMQGQTAAAVRCRQLLPADKVARQRRETEMLLIELGCSRDIFHV